MGRPSYWLNTRRAPPPTSGPTSAQTLLKKRELMTFTRPPRTQTAPPPSNSVSLLELASTNVRFWSVSRGWSWFWQWEVVHPCALSQVFMYRMRCLPAPLSVTRPLPSMTISGPLSLKIFAVLSSVRVTGSGPQSNVMTPPRATASTKAALVQLAGVPVPTTVVGLEMSARPASTGTAHVASAFGLPAGGPSLGWVSGLGTSTPGSSLEQPEAQASATPADRERTVGEGARRSLFGCMTPVYRGHALV